MKEKKLVIIKVDGNYPDIRHMITLVVRASTREKVQKVFFVYELCGSKAACASVQSDQDLRCSHSTYNSCSSCKLYHFQHTCSQRFLKIYWGNRKLLFFNCLTFYPPKDAFLRICSRQIYIKNIVANGEKLLMMRNFPIVHNIFNSM